MLIRRRAAPILGIIAFITTLILLQFKSRRPSWHEIPQVVGLGELIPDASTPPLRQAGWDTKSVFAPGHAKPPGSTYTKALVMAKTSEEDISWIDDERLDVVKKIYMVDNSSAALHPPKNKGREAMVYLTYIIEHYDDLPDISIFMHAHRWAWHNNDILNNDAAEMIRRLSSERVVREGYMNLRCHWMPGCPQWMHPGKVDSDWGKAEEGMMAKSWSELFPNDAIPQVIAQPCCAQFALSRDRIRAVTLSRYHWYRDWLFQTELRDAISGRIWEYLWHVVFTGQTTVCPDQHGCYCDGYGVCFDGEDGFERWFEIRAKKRDAETKLNELRSGAAVDAGLEAQYEGVIAKCNSEMDRRRWEALDRGRDPRVRARSVGRNWVEGVDGY